MGRSLCGTPGQVSPFPVTWSALLESCPARLVLEMRHLIPLSTLWLLWVRWSKIQRTMCVLLNTLLKERKCLVVRDEGIVIMSDHHGQMKEGHVVSERGRVSAERERVWSLRRTIGCRLTAVSSLPFPQDTRSMTSPWPPRKWGCLWGSGLCSAALLTPSSMWASNSTGRTLVRPWSVPKPFLLFCDRQCFCMCLMNSRDHLHSACLSHSWGQAEIHGVLVSLPVILAHNLHFLLSGILRFISVPSGQSAKVTRCTFSVAAHTTK